MQIANAFVLKVLLESISRAIIELEQISIIRICIVICGGNCAFLFLFGALFMLLPRFNSKDQNI